MDLAIRSCPATGVSPAIGLVMTLLVGCALEPDPGWVMFEQRAAPGGWDIYRVQFDGTPAVTASPAGASEYYPAWSQTLRRIAFETDRDGNWEIYSAAEDGSNPTRLTDDTASNVSSQDRVPAWSPNGQHIAFGSDRDGDFEIFTMRDTGSNERALTQNTCVDSEPAWSPDGTRIAYASDCSGDFDIWLIDAPNGTNPRSLVTRTGMHDTDPAWSPDGLWIVFESAAVNNTSGDSEIWKVRADGTGATALAREAGKTYVQPAWSPDGATIAFARLASGGSTYEIWLMENDGGRKTKISSSTLDEQAPVLGLK